MSLHWELVPVHYRIYEYGLFFIVFVVRNKSLKAFGLSGKQLILLPSNLTCFTGLRLGNIKILEKHAFPQDQSLSV